MSAATYFDGKSTRPHQVDLEVADDFLHITGPDVRRVEVLRALKFTVAYAHAPSRVELPGGATLEIADGAEFLSLRAQSNQAPGLVERFEASAQYALLALVVIVAAAAAGYQWGIPLVADLIVEHAPRSIDTRLGQGSLEQLESIGVIQPEQPLTEREKRLTLRFATLTANVNVPYHVQFRSFVGGPNAFALPDGTIVISTQIEALSDNDDALLFVMGHELGHLRFRHGIKSLARATMTSIIMTWYVGDVSCALALATAGIANLSYSRLAEAEADHFSAHLLHANGLSTKPAALLFHAMENYVPPEIQFKGGRLESRTTEPTSGSHPSANNNPAEKPSVSVATDDTAANDASSRAASNKAASSSASAAAHDASRTASKRAETHMRLPTYLSTHPATEERIKALEDDKD